MRNLFKKFRNRILINSQNVKVYVFLRFLLNVLIPIYSSLCDNLCNW